MMVITVLIVVAVPGCMSHDILLATITDISEAQELIRNNMHEKSLLKLEEVKNNLADYMNGNFISSELMGRAITILEDYIRTKYNKKE